MVKVTGIITEKETTGMLAEFATESQAKITDTAYTGHNRGQIF